MSARHFNASPQTADRRLWTWQKKSQLKPQQRTELSCSIFWCTIQLEGQQKNIHQHLRFKSHFRINLRPRHTKTSIKFWSINLHLYCNLIVQSMISATGFQIPGTVFHLNNMISLTPHIHRMAQQHIIWSYASVTLTQRSWTLHKVAPINFILNLNCTITYLIISPFLLFSSCSLSTIRQYLSELIFWRLGLCRSLPVTNNSITAVKGYCRIISHSLPWQYFSEDRKGIWPVNKLVLIILTIAQKLLRWATMPEQSIFLYNHRLHH